MLGDSSIEKRVNVSIFINPLKDSNKGKTTVHTGRKYRQVFWSRYKKKCIGKLNSKKSRKEIVEDRQPGMQIKSLNSPVTTTINKNGWRSRPMLDNKVLGKRRYNNVSSYNFINILLFTIFIYYLTPYKSVHFIGKDFPSVVILFKNISL